MAISSFNIQQASKNSFWHNSREAVVSYTIDDKNRNEINRNASEAVNYYRQLLKEATKNYTARTNQKIQTKEERFLWEAVVNLNANHTLKDVENLAKELEKKYGWQQVQIAVHKDEGHIENGKKKYNYHAHIVFFMLNKQGIYCFKKRDFNKKKMSEIQDLVAETLQMERGQSKKITKRERLEHREFKQLKQAEEKIIQNAQTVIEITVKELKKQIEAYRKELIQKNKELEEKKKEKVYTKEDYQALSALKKATKKDNLQEIAKEFEKLKAELDEKNRRIDTLKSKGEEYIDKYFDAANKAEALEAENVTLKQKIEALKAREPEVKIVEKEKIVEVPVEKIVTKTVKVEDTTRIKALEEKLAEKDKEIEQIYISVNETLKQKNKKIQELEIWKTETTKFLVRIGKTVNAKNWDELEQNISNLKAENATLKGYLQQIGEKLQATGESIADLFTNIKEKISSLFKREKELKEENKGLKLVTEYPGVIEFYREKVFENVKKEQKQKEKHQGLGL